MSTAAMTPADQAAAALVCVCGAAADKHYAKDHPFMERWAYDPATWKRSARFGRDELNPATNLYITVEDRMRISTIAYTGGFELDVVCRLQRPDGQVIPIRQQIFPQTFSTFANFDFDLCEGFLLDVALTTPSANVKNGMLFVVAQIIRQSGANAQPSRVLLSNYVTSGCGVGWPEGPNQQSTQGAGQIVQVSWSNPVAGAEFQSLSFAGQRVQLQSFSAQLVTSAVVGNRVPHIQFIVGAAVVWDCAASAAQVASTTVRYSFCGGVQPAINDGSAIIPIPDSGFMGAGWTVNSLTSGIQAGDQWQNIKSNQIVWIEP